ncbi:MAG: hypothetical protein KatS3mg050_1299 [Litorilinea sp.]|nr:MAG: hypothetical protein KatS3mg050_1299 [Litorilinea sp.]
MMTESMPTRQPEHPTADPALAAAPGTEEAEVLYCANHPNVETLLRCNKCGKPICLKCAQLTDVGYRCKECIRNVQDNYFNAVTVDNAIAFAVALVIAGIAVPILSILLGMLRGFFFWGLIIAFMLGGGAGGALAQIIRAAVGRRRGRYLRYFALAGIICGSLASLVLLNLPLLNLPLLVFGVLATATAFQILR